MYFMFFIQNRFVIHHSMLVGTTVNGQYCCPLLQDMVRLAVRCKEPELLEHHVILLLDNATPHCHNDVQNLVQCWGLEVLITSSLLYRSRPHVVTGCLHM
jgi:hypothetical protein